MVFLLYKSEKLYLFFSQSVHFWVQRINLMLMKRSPVSLDNLITLKNQSGDNIFTKNAVKI